MIQPSSPIVEYIDQSGSIVMSRDILQELHPVSGRAIVYENKNNLNKYRKLQPISSNNLGNNKAKLPEKKYSEFNRLKKKENKTPIVEKVTKKFVLILHVNTLI